MTRHRARWDAWGSEPVSCNVTMKVLSGSQVSELSSMKVSRRRSLATLCRGSVSSYYIKKLLGRSQGAFAVVATNAADGTLIGFARCSVYNSFAGGRTASAVPVTGRIVMLDLICADDGCAGLGKQLVRAIVDVSRAQFGATLLMLEATNRAAGFYAKFGFRRVPDACNWPSAGRLQAAQRGFQARKWDAAQTARNVEVTRDGRRIEHPGYKDAAAINRELGGVWWPHYDRPQNGTVIMSLCLGRQVPQGAYLAGWIERTAAGLLQQDIRGKNYASVADRAVDVPSTPYGFRVEQPAGVPSPSTPNVPERRPTRARRSSS